MKTNEDSPRSLDDVIFEHRNHDYGAYVIRRTYPDNVNKGVLMAIGVVAIVTIISILPKEMKPTAITRLPVEGTTFVLPPLIPKPLPPSQPTQVQRGTENLPPRPVTQDIVETTVTPVDQVIFGPEDGAEVGDPNATTISPNIPDEIGPSVPVIPETIFLTSEVLPTYVGGLNAMVHFISKNIRYPLRATRTGKEGTVYISFIIGKDGTVLDPKVFKGFDPDCDQEAIRVMNKMIKWNPGLQSGVPVMVRMVIPIKFALTE